MANNQVSVDIEFLRAATLVEVLEAIKCGKMNGIACLCDPNVREAATILAQRFGLREQAAVYSRLCGCVVQSVTPTSIQVTPASTTVPASVSTTPVVPTQAPSPAPVPPTPVPSPTCDPALQPKGTFTTATMK